MNSTKPSSTASANFEKPVSSDQLEAEATETKSMNCTDILDALNTLTRFTKNIERGLAGDFTSTLESAEKLSTALQTGRVALDLLTLEYNEQLDRAVVYWREFADGLAPLKVE